MLNCQRERGSSGERISRANDIVKKCWYRRADFFFLFVHARTDADSTFHSFGSRRSLPSQVPHRDKIVRASTGVLSFSVSLLFPVPFSPSLPLSARMSSPSPFQRVPSVILSGCITYRAIECPDHDLGTRAPIRSNYSIILSPCNAPRCTPAQEA